MQSDLFLLFCASARIMAYTHEVNNQSNEITTANDIGILMAAVTSAPCKNDDCRTQDSISHFFPRGRLFFFFVMIMPRLC